MADLAHRLEGLGYRMTPQRMMVVEAIESTDGHISAEDIYTQVKAKYPHVNISTVYRTLELLKNEGLVTETNLGEGRVRYHPAGKGHHHHLVCQKCGTVIDMNGSELAPLGDTLRKKYNFKADLRHLAIFGHCDNCSK